MFVLNLLGKYFGLLERANVLHVIQSKNLKALSKVIGIIGTKNLEQILFFLDIFGCCKTMFVTILKILLASRSKTL